MTVKEEVLSMGSVSDDLVTTYQRDGFVRIPGIISVDEAARFREIALNTVQHLGNNRGNAIFDQFINIWRDTIEIRELTLHPNVAAAATKLAGVPLRLWHDQMLIKKPHYNAATEFHQDQPYWPHANSVNPISCWIALQDVPVERGCMTFIPRSHLRTDLPKQQLADAESLFSICPELRWEPRVTVPLRAGDCTFHHGRCAHMATANLTDEARVAHVVIFVDESTRFNGSPHVVTNPLSLEIDQVLPSEIFPTPGEFAKLISR